MQAHKAYPPPLSARPRRRLTPLLMSEPEVAPVYSVVVPAYNSAGVLPELHRRLTAVLQALGQCYEIVFVDDCGPQDCWPTLQRLARMDAQVQAVQLMRNAGQAHATLCGLAHARGEFVVTMDDDLQHPPEELPRLIQAMTEAVDVVMAVPRRKQHSAGRRWGSAAMHHINCRLLQLPAGLHFSSFRLLRRPVVQGLLGLQTLSPALSPMIHTVTQRIVNVEFEHAQRAQGRSGYTLRRLLAHASNNIIGHSPLPLRWLALVGSMGIIFSLLGSTVLLARYVGGDSPVPGWTATALLLLLLSGLNFLAFAFLGEYVLRILQRANGTPQYRVRCHVAATDQGVACGQAAWMTAAARPGPPTRPGTARAQLDTPR